MARLFELKITLKGVTPEVWRLLAVPEDYSMYKLHHAIQITMGWLNYHLYQFSVGKESLGNPDLLEDETVISDKSLTLNHVFSSEGDAIEYEYDFGDGWLHEIRLERISPNEAETKVPVCIDWARACPPEDCGGPDGYKNILKALKNKKDPEARELSAWYESGLDPKWLTETNKQLRRLNVYIKEYEAED